MNSRPHASPSKSGKSKRRAGPKNRSESMSDPARRIAEPDPPAADPVHPVSAPAPPRASARASRFDGFQVEIDLARERADVILDRPPLNVITMAEREQLRATFEALDGDQRIRVIVLRAQGEHFSSGGEIRGFLDASPEHLSRLAWNIARRRAAASRSSPPAAAIASESPSSWRWPAISASSSTPASSRCPSSGSA
jgi:enoyl-CoA hydratase/isomerase-like protein